MTIDLKKMMAELTAEAERLRGETPKAGTGYRLMGLAADMNCAADELRHEVLERVKEEAVVDVDVDVDYDELSDEVLALEMDDVVQGDYDFGEQTRQVNGAVGELSGVLAEIASQLERRHRDEEFARLYDQEKRRFLNSGTARRARVTFDEWLLDVCSGSPTMDDISDYITEKLVHMFDRGVFASKVEHIQRATCYQGEFDFGVLDDDHRLRATAHKHYAALRKVVDFADGYLVVDAVKVGRHFFACRHEENAKGRRTALLKYMYKIELAQAERRKLLAAEAAEGSDLNYFAPSKHLKALLRQEWFALLRTDARYDEKWTDEFIGALMRSEHRDYIAREWSNKRQDFVRGCILGLLREGKVVKGSMDSIARSTGVCENYRTLSRYMGQCRQEPYAQWVLEYLEEKSM